MKDARILVSITCDTEFLPPWYKGSWEHMSTWSFKEGTPIFRQLLEQKGIPGTFFCQGTVIEWFPDHVRAIAEAGHFVGSHGYNHEVYGGRPPVVWTAKKPVMLTSVAEKRARLEKCIQLHTNLLGKHPEAFVAPFDIVDAALLGLLEDVGFKVDSSYHNYSIGMNSFPFCPLQGKALVEIPLTVIAISGISKNLLEAFTFDPFRAEEKLGAYIETSLMNFPFCAILITCHPYEFLDMRTPHPREALIVGQEKQDGLNRLIQVLAKKNVRFVTIMEMAEAFREISERDEI